MHTTANANSEQPALFSATESTPAKEQNKIKPQIQHQTLEKDRLAPPKPSAGHNQELSAMEGIVSISAASSPSAPSSSPQQQRKQQHRSGTDGAVAAAYEYNGDKGESTAQSLPSLLKGAAHLNREHQRHEHQQKERVHTIANSTMSESATKDYQPRDQTLDPYDHHHPISTVPARANTSSPVRINDKSEHGRGHHHGLQHGHQHPTSDDEVLDEDVEYDHDEGLDGDHHMDPNIHRHQHPSDEKYKRLKRKLKEVLEENERMGNELDKSRRRSRNLRREKNLLLDRLCVLEKKDSDLDTSLDSLSSCSSDSDSSDSSILEEIRSKKISSTGRIAPTSASGGGKSNGTKIARATPSSTTAQYPKKIAGKNSSGANRATFGKESKNVAAAGTSTVSSASTITNVGSATQKPKRIHQPSKQRPGLAKVRKVQALEKDENGNIRLPVTVGIITLQCIGHVVHDREAFHNDRYIWPVGYKMSRSYNSMIDPEKLTTYTCSVIDDGEAPKFQIEAEDQPGKPIIAGTATGAWTHVVKAANAIRKRDHSNSASGPDYFGFSNATIAKMIQDLPGVEKCESYVMQQFEEPSAAPTAATSNSAGTSGTVGASSSASGEKRKMATLSSKAKANLKLLPEQGAEDVEEEEEDDSYASLGTPGKKKARVASPKIRHAGFEAPPTTSAASAWLESVDGTSSLRNSVLPEQDLKADDRAAEINGDETQSESDVEQRRLASGSVTTAVGLNTGIGKPGSKVSIHSAGTLGDTRPMPVIVPSLAESGDSEVIDVEDQDSDVDIGMDEDVLMRDPSTSPSPVPKDGGS